MPDIDPNLPDGDVNDEGQPNAGGTSRFYSEEDYKAAIEAARQQEKDKLYGRISKDSDTFKALQGEVAELRKTAKAAEKAEAERQAAVDAERRKAAEAELSAKELIERRQAEWNAQIDAIRIDAATQIELLRKENEFTRLQAYIQRRTSEESDNIAPELLDFVTGDSVEAVEASIERVKAKTAQIVESMRQAGIRHRASLPGVAPASGANGVTPMDQPGDRQITKEDIEKMGMPEYAALRTKLGMDRLSSNTGLFGNVR